MRLAHTAAQVRAAEEPLLAAGVPLMARASTGLAVEVARRLPFVYGARVVLVVGKGNNGADALFAGAWLARRGAAVVAVLHGDPVPDALDALVAASGRTGGPEALAGADVVVDGLVGIGGRGPVDRPSWDAFTVAVDVPSGVDADTGEVHEGAVRADVTVTFGTVKPGLLLARDHVGEVVLVDIGLDPGPAPVEQLEPADVRRLLPPPDRLADKYSRGVLGVCAGSAQYPGAAVLAVGAAIRAGAGMVRYAGAAAEAVRAAWPEAVVTNRLEDAGRVQAWVVGPGLGLDLDPVAWVLGQDVPVLVDADALTVCAQHPQLLRDRTAPTLLTPHDRELARFRELTADRIGTARALARELGVHVLLKGDATVVVGPEGPARVNATGSAVLATAGSGDVLAGGTGALLAQGLEPLDAGSVGAFVHGVAGTLSAGGATTSAGRVLEAWPAAVAETRARD